VNNQQYDKIRVLWIEDLPGRAAQEATLEETLERYDTFFEIVGENKSACRSFEQYDTLLGHHFSYLKNKGGHQKSPLPVEIIAADYDLSKFNPGSEKTGDKNRRSQHNYSDMRGSSGSKFIQDECEQLSDGSTLLSPDYNDYDGCIINAMYLSEFSSHPCGSIITTYQEPSLRHKCAKKLENHLLRCYEIDVTFSVRTWTSVLHAGVKALRNRIKQLYEAEQIILFLPELMKLLESKKDQIILTIKSSHALRKLPVQGLFIDVHENDRDMAIHDWVKNLLESKVTIESFIYAKKLAKDIWSTYNDDSLINDYMKLSLLHVEGGQLESEYKRLDREFFKLKKTKRGIDTFECTNKCLDIASLGVSPATGGSSVLRWTALLLIRRLLKRILIFIMKTNIGYKERDASQRIESLFPTFEEDDILLLLYPVPKSPFPSIWHIEDAKIRGNKKGGWVKWMNDNLGFSPRDVIEGTALTLGERHIMQGIAMAEDTELGVNAEDRLEQWASYEPAKLFIYGQKY